MLLIDDQLIYVTDDGFLSDRSVWNERIATALADRAGIALSTEHWKIISYVRDFYKQYELLPPVRILVKNLSALYGAELGNSMTLHRLFPDSPMKWICLIGGLPKPKHCM